MMEWYEQLDFDENPFQDNEDTKLVGFDDIIDEIHYRIHSGSIVFIEGDEGSGKTALLRKAINTFKGRGKVIYINCKKVDEPNIVDALRKKYGLFSRLFRKLPRDMIVLVDGVEELSQKNCERIKNYFDQNYVKSIVFTGNNINSVNFTDSLKERISKVIRIKDITDDDAVDIIHARLDDKEIIPDKVIKDVFGRSKRNTKQFIENCEKLCKYAAENNGKAVGPEMVDFVLEGKPLEIKDEQVV